MVSSISLQITQHWKPANRNRPRPERRCSIDCEQRIRNGQEDQLPPRFLCVLRTLKFCVQNSTNSLCP